MASNLVGKIDHVVVVMMENRGFDTMLGYLYSQSDLPNHQIPPPQPSHHAPPFFGLEFVNTDALVNTGTHNGTPISQKPVPIVRATNSTGWDPGEEYEHVNAQIFDIDPTNDPPAQAEAKMTGFIRDYSLKCTGDSEAVKQIMHMYTPADLPVLSRLAKGYAVSDLWFASVPTQTNANRAFSLCGTSNGLVDNGFLTTDPVSEKLANDRFDIPTLWNVLENNGATDWGIFWEDVYPPVIGKGKPYTENLFPQLGNIPNVQTKFRKMDEFYEMAEEGKLPKFSYIEPKWGGYIMGISVMGNEFHPPSDVTPGEHLLARIYNSLRANIETWNKTLFLIMFDEHGGTYDHIPPGSAIPPWGDTQPTLPKGKQYNFNFDRFGLRVPAIAISPLIDKKTVFRSMQAQPFDHTSMIATVLEWLLPNVSRKDWGLGERVNNAPTFDQIVTRSQPRNDNALAPSPPTSNTIQYGESFYLQYRDTQNYVSKAYEGVKSYYPTLATENPQWLDFRFGFGPVNDGDTVQLHTSEYLEPLSGSGIGFFAGIRNFLGAWKDDSNCYYYSTDDAENYQQQY